MEAVNTAEGIVHDTESKMEEFKDQLPADEVQLHTLFYSFMLVWFLCQCSNRTERPGKVMEF